MSTKSDYIPPGEEDFNAWQQNFINVVGNKYEHWKIPHSEYFSLLSFQTNWHKFYLIAGKKQKTTRTFEEVKLKRDARKSFVSALRPFVVRWISRNPELNISDRQNLQLPLRESTHLRPPTPTSKPACIKIAHNEHLQLVLDIRDEQSLSVKKMPDKVKEVEVWGIWIQPGQVIPPAEHHDHLEFGFIAGFTSHNAKIKFIEARAGSTLLFRLRWLNSRKEFGPWSAVYHSVIL